MTLPGSWPGENSSTSAWSAPATDPTTPEAPLTAEQVAGYLAKFATKDAASLRTSGQTRPHLSRMTAICYLLTDHARAAAAATTPAEVEHQGDAESSSVEPSPYRLLGKWAHMLGFRGHFSTKSRRYSVTLGALRRARHRFQILAADARRTGQVLDTRDLEVQLLADAEDDTTLVIGSWTYQGTGWTMPGDQALALAAAGRAREYDQWKAAQLRTA